MRALQLHYTSCRRGQAAGAGFQTRALTPGILPDEVREIERRGLYRPPRDARQEPTPEQIEAELPRSLRFYTLETGRRALTRSGYAGQDYSGRWGNYFAHTLVFEGDVPPIWPVDFYEWEGWVDRLSPADDTEAEPAPLPAVDLAEIAPGESFTLEDLREFLREQPGRVQVLERMARAVLLQPENGRPVVVRDTPLNGLYWIACVQKLFPPRHALHLSFSSYQYDARGAALLNATTGETDFTFGETERQYQFQAFDLAAGVHSDVPAADGDYPALAVRWLAEDPARLDDFIEFTALFSHDRPDGGLADAARLFHLSSGGEGDLSGTQLAGILDLVEGHTPRAARGRVLGMVLQAARQARGEGWAPEDHARLIGFLAGEARASGEPGHRALALAAWRSLLERRVLAGGEGTAAAAEGWRQVRAAFARSSDELEDWRAGAVALGAGRPPAARPAPGRAGAPAARGGGRAGGPGEDALEPAREVVSGLLEGLLRSAGDAPRATRLALEALRGGGLGAGALADACRLLADAAAAQPPGTPARAAPAAIGAGLGEVLGTIPAQDAAAVRASLDGDAGGWRILYGEWSGPLAASADPVADFRRYRTEVLDRLPGYAGACRGAVMASLLERLPDGRAGKVALEWLRTGELASLPPERRAGAVARAAGALPLDDTSAPALQRARRVAAAAAEAGVALRPDRPRLLESLAAAAARGGELEPLKLEDAARALEGIDAPGYGRFLEGFLPSALDRARSRREHGRVLAAAYRAEHHDAFAAGYRAWFRAPPTGRPAQPFRVAVKFWLHSDPTPAAPLARLAKLAEEECIRALAGMEPRSVAWLRDELKPAGDALARWRRWEDAVEERRRGPLARLGQWGRTLFGR